jgi:hypothetical protein
MNQLSPVVEASTRELAQRRSGTVEILLLWHAEIDRVEISLHDSSTGAGFYVDVPPGNALDAFYHPYAYAPRHESPCEVGEADVESDDG